ncbi:MAG: hypothetical protein N2544_08845 [Burkholderiales bacterium]|nr:hypothetical protein [Burkholderiales bacterium]
MFLARSAALAAAGLTAKLALLGEVLALGTVEKGVYRVRGDARVNGEPAKPGMDVKAGDVITTGPNGELVFVVNRDAFLVRRNSRVEVEGTVGALIASGLRVVTGAVLSVFAPSEPKRVTTPTATIGIRGTGLYVEVEPSWSYVCTCYGTVDIEAVADPAQRETITTRHHEQPRYVYASGAAMMVKAPVFNHSDAELILLESLVGRVPPFGAQGGTY